MWKFKPTYQKLDDSLEHRKLFLDENLEAWIMFEEYCDEINAHLDQTENENKIDLKLDSLQKVDYHLEDLRRNRENMVGFCLFLIFEK